MGNKILIAGTSGLVGNHFIRKAAQMSHIEAIYSIGRSEVKNMPNGAIHFKAKPQDWAKIIRDLDIDIACSCLGTTIKKAGSQQAFAAIDFELVKSFFEAARMAGAKQAIAVSSTMANAAAKHFYLQVKGQAELAIKGLNFDRTDIMRPGLLKGKRDHDYRLGERAAIIASSVVDLLLHGKYRKFRSIAAKDVSAAMAILSSKSNYGYFIHENDEILHLLKRM